MIFSGTFRGPVSWTEVTTPGPNGSVYYIVTGAVSGTWYTGATVNGATTQITFSAGKSGSTGSVTLGCKSCCRRFRKADGDCLRVERRIGFRPRV